MWPFKNKYRSMTPEELLRQKSDWEHKGIRMSGPDRRKYVTGIGTPYDKICLELERREIA